MMKANKEPRKGGCSLFAIELMNVIIVIAYFRCCDLAVLMGKKPGLKVIRDKELPTNGHA